MKMSTHLLLAASLVCLVSAPNTVVTAQVFKTLYAFTTTPGFQSGTNADGAWPDGVTLSGNTLYGAAKYGGAVGDGTVFKVNTDGTGFSAIHQFVGVGDGAGPFCSLVLSGNTFYGTTVGGGLGWPATFGTVFAINTDGTGETILHVFGFTEPNSPKASLVLSGTTLYGMTEQSVFAVNTDGTGFRTLHTSAGNDGYYSYGPLALSGSTLFGANNSGGSYSNGTVFAVNTDGSGYVTLHHFTATSGSFYAPTNADGANPITGVIVSGGTLYGAAELGGGSAAGTVFAMNLDGSGFRVLHDFTVDDGAGPSGLLLSGNTLFGVTAFGGSSTMGTVFRLTTDGKSFKKLYDFTAVSALPPYNNDGAQPSGGLVLLGNTLFGTAQWGGSGRNGTVFSISLPPELTITPMGGNVILNWPSNSAGVSLQSSTNLGSAANWVGVSAVPTVVNGQNVLTNPVSGRAQFFRLSQ